MSNHTPTAGHRQRAPLWLFIALSALVVPALLAAQEPARTDSSHCICWNQNPTNLARMSTLSAPGRHAMIGVTIAPDSGRGVHVEDVTAGGPAARAGLKAGDVITRIDDVDLGAMTGSKAQDALIAHLRDVQPGDTVAVTVRRTGKTQRAKIVTEEGGAFGFFSDRDGRAARIFVSPGARGLITPGTPEIREFVRTRVAGALSGIPGLNVVDVNPALGKYFGTDRGVLVVNVDSDSALGLEPGDVILQIGGRTVEDAGHALQILRSYRPDEEIRMQVMRDKHRTTVTGHTR
ncbi:MAG TPA: PDZ domain-containing protein [Longimicrobiales bacterium]|nr:PDZ domain-containing protein [Longimicrobiales bacterium]